MNENARIGKEYGRISTLQRAVGCCETAGERIGITAREQSAEREKSVQRRCGSVMRNGQPSVIGAEHTFVYRKGESLIGHHENVLTEAHFARCGQTEVVPRI